MKGAYTIICMTVGLCCSFLPLEVSLQQLFDLLQACRSRKLVEFRMPPQALKKEVRKLSETARLKKNPDNVTRHLWSTAQGFMAGKFPFARRIDP